MLIWPWQTKDSHFNMGTDGKYIYIYSKLKGHTDTVMPKKLSGNSKITELRQFDCLGC